MRRKAEGCVSMRLTNGSCGWLGGVLGGYLGSGDWIFEGLSLDMSNLYGENGIACSMGKTNLSVLNFPSR